MEQREYLLKFAFLIALNFDNEIGSKLAFKPTAFTSNNMTFHFVLVGRTFSTTFSPVTSVRLCIGKGDNDGRQSGSCLPSGFPRFLQTHVPMVTGATAFLGICGLSIKFCFKHTVNGVSCRITHVYTFKGDDLATRPVHMYRPMHIKFFGGS